MTAEVFQRDRAGLLATRIVSLPGTFGTTMPQENLNSDRTRGFELELRHRNRIGDFNYSVSGNMSLTRTQRRYVERTASGNSYANWMATNNTNRYNDIWMGWGANGRFETWHDMAYAPAYGKGNGSNISLPGDYIYEDWNGDGVIDDNDKHPIATTISKNGANQNYPLLNFGLTLSGDWHGIDCDFTFKVPACRMSLTAISWLLLWAGTETHWICSSTAGIRWIPRLTPTILTILGTRDIILMAVPLPTKIRSSPFRKATIFV